MASWTIHLIIADRLMQKLNNIDQEYFVIGSIAPDCGIKAGNGYIPDSETTHLTHNGNNKSNCDYQFIMDNYVKNSRSVEERSFWLGYYAHLVTDVIWSTQLYYRIKDSMPSPEEQERFRQVVRREWQHLDKVLMLKQPPKSYEIFRSAKPFNQPYPEFYTNNEIQKQQQNIINIYDNIELQKMDYEFTNPAEIISLIEIISDEIIKAL